MWEIQFNYYELVNRRDAGYAELDVTVTSPLGRHLPIEVKGTSDGEGELIEFTPTVPGKYKIAITYGGIEVPGMLNFFICSLTLFVLFYFFEKKYSLKYVLHI